MLLIFVRLLMADLLGFKKAVPLILMGELEWLREYHRLKKNHACFSDVWVGKVTKLFLNQHIYLIWIKLQWFLSSILIVFSSHLLQLLIISLDLYTSRTQGWYFWVTERCFESQREYLKYIFDILECRQDEWMGQTNHVRKIWFGGNQTFILSNPVSYIFWSGKKLSLFSVTGFTPPTSEKIYIYFL